MRHSVFWLRTCMRYSVFGWWGDEGGEGFSLGLGGGEGEGEGGRGKGEGGRKGVGEPNSHVSSPPPSPRVVDIRE